MLTDKEFIEGLPGAISLVLFHKELVNTKTRLRFILEDQNHQPGNHAVVDWYPEPAGVFVYNNEGFRTSFIHDSTYMAQIDTLIQSLRDMGIDFKTLRMRSHEPI